MACSFLYTSGTWQQQQQQYSKQNRMSHRSAYMACSFLYTSGTWQQRQQQYSKQKSRVKEVHTMYVSHSYLLLVHIRHLVLTAAMQRSGATVGRDYLL
jgi:hypothetical protein